ncbi:MAG: peptidyl-prolyl cis-trans isomerase [Myxococcales bacterium]|nr:peptidyl-prolyl cis-trans isomerase [Myxococcales bacterium]
MLRRIVTPAMGAHAIALCAAIGGAQIVAKMVTKAAAQSAPSKAPQAEKEGAVGTAAEQATPANGDAARRKRAVATFKMGEITVGQLEDTIAGYNPLMRLQYHKQEQRETLLKKTLELELLAAEATRRGFGKDQEVAHATRQHAVQTMIQADFDEGESLKQVPEQEVRTYYDANLTEYMRPEMRRASHIKVATKAEADEILAKVKKADLRLFRRLAREKSLDAATKLRGGDLRYFDTQGKTPGNDGEGAPLALARAAFSLKTSGEVFGRAIEVEGGYSVVKLTGIRQKNERTFDQVKGNIRLRLWREKRKKAIDDLVDKLKAEHKPEVHADLIGLVKLDTSPPVPRSNKLPTPFPKKSEPAPAR